MDRSEMEKAYRRRLGAARWGLSGIAFALLTVVHFTFGPLWVSLLLIAVMCAVLGGWGERLLFPHAWRTFDAPRPSPALEEEARALARSMGMQMTSLRVNPKHSTSPFVHWRGRTAIVNTALRDLPPEERRYALARALALAPNAPVVFVRHAALPTFYATWTAWCFDLGSLALGLGAALSLGLLIAMAQAPGRWRRASSRAVALAGEAAGLAYWRHLETLGSPEASRELTMLKGQRASKTGSTLE